MVCATPRSTDNQYRTALPTMIWLVRLHGFLPLRFICQKHVGYPNSVHQILWKQITTKFFWSWKFVDMFPKNSNQLPFLSPPFSSVIIISIILLVIIGNNSDCRNNRNYINHGNNNNNTIITVMIRKVMILTIVRILKICACTNMFQSPDEVHWCR